MYFFVVLCSAFLLGYLANATSQVVINHPNAATPFLGIVSDYSSDTEISDWTAHFVHHLNDDEGCNEWQSIDRDAPNSASLIGLVDRGTCTFLEKTRLAQLAGLDALFIASTDETVTGMAADESELESFGEKKVLLTIMVPQSFKAFITQNQENESIAVTIDAYKRQIWDIAMVIAVITSSILVCVGAYYSNDMERAQMYPNNNNNPLRRRAPIQEINDQMAWAFICVASMGLMTLYFFIAKIFMLFLLIFCISATNGLSHIFSHCIDIILPNLQHRTYYLKRIDLQFNVSDILGLIPAIVLSVVWYISRQQYFAWILQNILCVGLLLILQRSIRFTNLKIASILLSTAFFYDIFWVFVSPLFFESSVMVAVATYKHGGVATETLPVVLKFPRFNDVLHSPMILGLGDIALPGLLVSYLLRCDYQMKVGIDAHKGYFVPCVIGYTVGMILTDINLILMQSGQPALLFLVPCTLGTTLFLSYRRGDLSVLWNGIPNAYTAITTNSHV